MDYRLDMQAGRWEICSQREVVLRYPKVIMTAGNRLVTHLHGEETQLKGRMRDLVRGAFLPMLSLPCALVPILGLGYHIHIVLPCRPYDETTSPALSAYVRSLVDGSIDGVTL